VSAPAAHRHHRAQQLAAEQLRAAGAPHPEVGAALLVARGLRGRDAQELAAILGVSAEHLRSLESGHRPALHAPRRLREVEPSLDWLAAGVTPPGHPADPAARHPAGRWRAVQSSRM
jgi:hypothetical protein